MLKLFIFPNRKSIFTNSIPVPHRWYSHSLKIPSAKSTETNIFVNILKETAWHDFYFAEKINPHESDIHMFWSLKPQSKQEDGTTENSCIALPKPKSARNSTVPDTTEFPWPFKSHSIWRKYQIHTNWCQLLWFWHFSLRTEQNASSFCIG